MQEEEARSACSAGAGADSHTTGSAGADNNPTEQHDDSAG